MQQTNTDKAQIINPFPSWIYKVKLDIDVEKVCDKINKLVDYKDNNWTLWLSHWTHGNLAELDKEFADIADQIAAEANKFYAWSKGIERNLSLMQTKRMWFNVYRKGGFMRPHDHYEAYYGSSLYLSTTQETSPIVFSHPAQVKFNTVHMEYPQPGELLIWPGWMFHEVPVNMTDDNRILLSAKIDYKINHFGLDNRRIDEDLLNNGI